MFEVYINDILLPMRFPTLPEEPHWEYFKSIFKHKYKDKKATDNRDVYKQ